MSDKLTKKNAGFNERTIIAYLLIASICIGGYVVPNTNLSLGLVSAFIIACFMFFYNFIICKRTFLVNKWLSIFIVYILFSQLILFTANGEIVILKRLINVVISTFIIFVFYNLVNEESFLKAYIVVGILCSIGLLYHSILVYILKQPVSPIILLHIKFIPENNWAYNIMRPMSIFQEPQAYAGFILPLLVYTIYNKKIILGIFLATCVLLSTSSTGIIMMIAICLYIALFINKNKIYSVVFLILIIIMLLFSLESDLFKYSINKIININFSNDIRLTNGFAILKHLNYKYLFFGVGAGNISNIMLEESINLPSYISTFSGIIIDYGIIGLFLYCYMLYKLIKGQNKIGKLFAYIIIILSFTQTILFNISFVNYYVSYFICSRKKDNDFLKYRI